MPDNTDMVTRFMTQLAIQGFEYSMNNRSRPDDNAMKVLEGMECFAMNMKPQKFRKGIYYRARVVDTKDINEDKGFSINDDGKICSGFNELESGKAPECFVKAGRINHEWESIWYLANDAYTAMAEVRPGAREQISLAKYRVVDNTEIYVLNFAEDQYKMKDGFETKGTVLEGFDLNKIYVLLQKIMTLPAYNERTYFISNIAADMIKKAGVSGVKYKSFYGKGNNIALWSIDKEAMVYCGSKVFLNYCTNQAFISLEDASVINNTSMFNKQVKNEASKAINEAQKLDKEIINTGRR